MLATECQLKKAGDRDHAVQEQQKGNTGTKKVSRGPYCSGHQP